NSSENKKFETTLESSKEKSTQHYNRQQLFFLSTREAHQIYKYPWKRSSHLVILVYRCPASEWPSHFGGISHPGGRYGLREFVVIAPAANSEAVLSESKCNLLLSSVSIALGNTGCQVPLFVQIHHKWRRMYVGECQGPGVRTDFEMVHLRKVPNQYTHLSGLLDIFKSKIGCPLTPLPPVSIAIRFTYVLQDWQQYFWPQQPPDIDALVGGEVGGLEFGKLPFGACEDPISLPSPKFLFPDAASEKPLDGASSTDSNNLPSENEEYNLYNQFKSAPSDSLTYKLALCLCMINFYHGGLKGVAHLWQEFVLEMRFRWENNFLIPGLASGPPDLRCCLLHQKLQMLNCCIERKKARDEGRKTSTSDNVTNTCPGDAGKAGEQPDVGKSWDSWSDSEEEFFECLSDTEELKANGQESGRKGGLKEMANLKPEGRLHQHGKLTLLQNGEPLYIPITQEPAPMTEDLLEEQSEVLAKLGTSAEGAHLRARMQSACLLSDMESFKVGHTVSARILWPCGGGLQEGMAGGVGPGRIFPGAVTFQVHGRYLSLEIKAALSLSFHYPSPRFVSGLLEQPEVLVVGAGRGHAGRIIHKLFVNVQRVCEIPYHLYHDLSRPPLSREELKRMGPPEERRQNSVSDFPPPAGRELLLRTTVPRPAPYSRALPQRMYSVLTKEDFRLAGAFSSDTSFF
ncbi:PREDICTED: rab3 GTPase-activating protein catalytic subunit, partial [Hipposideros armiger]|uniref:Rab3 GTPase-activating protein catalytic subunit n=1 Tax=Hipposideros armiger TaxID=186990 RepID=A0A8B7SU21_HIPAR